VLALYVGAICLREATAKQVAISFAIRDGANVVEEARGDFFGSEGHTSDR
jgi:hypothetical protein